MKKQKTIHKGVKKIDKLVTGLIIWWALASVVGASRTKKWKKVTESISEAGKTWAQKCYEYLGKTIVWVIKFFQKK